MSETINVEAIFGENVFNDSVMKERLPKSVYKKLKQTIEDGSELDPTIADVVAQSFIAWATTSAIVGSSSLPSSMVCFNFL